MKKVLFATTALVAAAAAGAASAGDVKISLDGYARAGVGAGGYYFGDKVEKDFHVITDGEIHFKGKGVLDNGLEISTRVELEAFSVTDQIDENWVSVKSQLGRILIGGNDDAGYNVGYVGITSVSIGVSNQDTTYEFSPVAIGTIGGRDAYGVHYYTPKIFGLELGVSYQPNLTDPNAGYTSSDAGNVATGSERVAFGAAYSNTFGDVSFTIGGAYIYTGVYDGVGSGEHTSEWGIGISLGFSGFTLDGRYENVDGSDTTDTERYAAGLTYSTGPWSFGIAAAFEDTTSDEKTWIGGGFTYELGNGVALGGAVTYGSDDNDTGNDEEGFGGNILLGINF